MESITKEINFVFMIYFFERNSKIFENRMIPCIIPLNEAE
jgi:hypothetical protein